MTKPAAKKAAKKQAKPKAPQKPLTPWEKWTADPERAIDDLCERVENGESLTGIAESKGVATSTVTRWIAADPQRSARARESRIMSAAVHEENALRELQGASDPFELARAKEVAHHLRWRAAKVNPREYGERTTLAGDPDAPVETKLSGTVNVTNAPLDEYLKAVRGT